MLYLDIPSKLQQLQSFYGKTRYSKCLYILDLEFRKPLVFSFVKHVCVLVVLGKSSLGNRRIQGCWHSKEQLLP